MDIRALLTDKFFKVDVGKMVGGNRGYLHHKVTHLPTKIQDQFWISAEDSSEERKGTRERLLKDFKQKLLIEYSDELHLYAIKHIKEMIQVIKGCTEITFNNTVTSSGDPVLTQGATTGDMFDKFKEDIILRLKKDLLEQELILENHLKEDENTDT